MALQLQFSTYFFFLVFLASGHCAEIDSVTPRGIDLKDSLQSLNTIINSRIQEGVDNANRSQASFGNSPEEGSCDEEILYRELRKSIYGTLTASWGLKGYSLDKQLRTLLAEQSYSLPLDESVYRDISYLEGFSLNLKELSDVVRIDGHLIGLDKIGHFFAEGWEYFEITHTKDSTLEEALQWGHDQEEGKFGYITTGIFSYADLVANLNGWRFWNTVLPGGTDPLKGWIANLFTSSYIGCGIQLVESIRSRTIVRAWTIKKNFNLMDYLDGTWDEGNNCVSYKDPEIEEKVLSRIKFIAPDYSCPVSPADCKKAVLRYGGYSKSILHPQCLTTLDHGPKK